GGGDGRTVRRGVRPEAGAVLDRGGGRRERRVGLPRQTSTPARGGAAASAAGRAEGAGARDRVPPGPGMHALREAGGLPEDHAVDERRAALGEADLRGGGVPAGQGSAPPRGRGAGGGAGLGVGFEGATFVVGPPFRVEHGGDVRRNATLPGLARARARGSLRGGATLPGRARV